MAKVFFRIVKNMVNKVNFCRF